MRQTSRDGASISAWKNDELTIIADAAFYYLDDLRQRLMAGSRLDAPGLTLDSPEEVVALAYRRWGPDLTAHLEGDFAFALWDSRQRVFVAARDFAGSRPLYWTSSDGSVQIASSVGKLREGREREFPVDASVVAAAAAGLSLANGLGTAFGGINTLLAGHTLVWRPDSAVRCEPHWNPPEWRTPSGSFDDAAVELRELLLASVRERMSRTGLTAIAVSGGWDSTAIFAAARHLITDGQVSADTVQLSISYPPDDPGHEDELIRLALDHWDASSHWLDSEQIRLFEKLDSAAERRDQPMAHLFEPWNRALARAARDAGADVLFTGYGGDQLFQVSDAYMADLFRSLRWMRLRKEWKGKRGSGLRAFVRWAVLPLLPDRALSALGLLRGGRRIHRYLERPLPPWVDRGFARRERLAQRDREFLAPRGMSRAEAESRWYLTNPFFPAVNSWVAEFGADVGVSVRSPLFDRRIVDFQAGRPWSDRSWEAETKILLRQSMVGLLPWELLAPRTTRTGVTSGYARRQMSRDLPLLVRRLQEDGLRLADMGIVDGGSYVQYALDAFEGRAPQHELTAFMTLSAELWLRGLESDRAPDSGCVGKPSRSEKIEVVHG